MEINYTLIGIVSLLATFVARGLAVGAKRVKQRKSIVRNWRIPLAISTPSLVNLVERRVKVA